MFGHLKWFWRDAVSKLETFVWILNPVNPKNIILTQLIDFNIIFHVVESVYRFVQIWNSPQSPTEFGMANSTVLKLKFSRHSRIRAVPDLLAGFFAFQGRELCFVQRVEIVYLREYCENFRFRRQGSFREMYVFRGLLKATQRFYLLV